MVERTDPADSRYEVITISNPVEFEMRVALMDLDNPGRQVIVVLDQMEEDTLTIREIQQRVQSRLGTIQITESYLGPVEAEETLAYYKEEPLYFKVKSEVIAKLGPDLNFEPFKCWLEDLINGQQLFKEISQLTKLDPKSFYLYIEQDMKNVKISRNSTATKWDFNRNRDSTLFIKKIRTGDTQVSVVLTSQRSTKLGIQDETTVAELKELADISLKVPCDASIIIFKGDSLSDEIRLKDAKIEEGAQITCHRRNRAERESMEGLSYVDLDNNKAAKVIRFTKIGKEWEIVRHGLCVEGICENQECVAYGCRVIVNKGFRVINPVLDRPKFLCPMCDSIVKYERIAFNNCIFELHEKVFKDGESVPKFEVSVVGNEYVRDENKDDWSFLKIVTKKSTETVGRCIICKKPVEPKDNKSLCKHSIHEACKKFAKECFLCKPIA